MSFNTDIKNPDNEKTYKQVIKTSKIESNNGIPCTSVSTGRKRIDLWTEEVTGIQCINVRAGKKKDHISS